LHGLLGRKALEDLYLPAVLLRASAQIRSTIQTKLMGPDPGDRPICSNAAYLRWTHLHDRFDWSSGKVVK